MARQLNRAQREIVQAMVQKAKEGSISHTKWLWSQAEQARRDGDRAPEVSLAEMLLASLGPVTDEAEK